MQPMPMLAQPQLGPQPTAEQTAPRGLFTYVIEKYDARQFDAVCDEMRKVATVVKNSK